MTTTTATERPAFTLEGGLGFRIGRTHRLLRGAWEARIADLGLSGPQASVLRAAVEQPGVGLRELARILATDPMNAKRLADGLERAGLMRSGGDPDDLRRRVLEPTAEGLALGETLLARAVEWRRTLEAIVGPEDVARLRAILERIEEGVTALADPAPVSGTEAAHD